ncbi:MAG: MmgE/PrpD family protein [Pseudomonadota bacterium]
MSVSNMGGPNMGVTDQLVELSGLAVDALPASALEMARFSLFDWMVCARAGRNEPLSKKFRAFAAAEGGKPFASIVDGSPTSARLAALVNGSISHALDFDDTHFAHIGHLSVGIYPAALAMAEELDLSANALVEAFLIGAEAAIRLGMVLGSNHYNHGFHQTATAGAFGATIAAGRLLGLTKVQIRHALGLCATRASGLKSQFGTMGKPYNAGIAASNGVECAKLAKLDFTSADDAVMGPQGFVPTHNIADIDTTEWPIPTRDAFLFEDNKYKFHACCHGLHAMIEALLKIRTLGAEISNVEHLEIRTNPRWLKVCDNKSPKTALETKFSYLWLAGMTLRGDTTGDDRLYSDELARDPQLTEFAERVRVIGDENLSDLQVAGAATLKTGDHVPVEHDLAAKLPSAKLKQKLRAKAVALLGGEGREIWDNFNRLNTMSAREIGQIIAQGTEVATSSG